MIDDLLITPSKLQVEECSQHYIHYFNTVHRFFFCIWQTSHLKFPIPKPSNFMICNTCQGRLEALLDAGTIPTPGVPRREYDTSAACSPQLERMKVVVVVSATHWHTCQWSGPTFRPVTSIFGKGNVTENHTCDKSIKILALAECQWIRTMCLCGSPVVSVLSSFIIKMGVLLPRCHRGCSTYLSTSVTRHCEGLTSFSRS